MENFSLDLLHAFIVKAKAATYIGSGALAPSHRPGSHDLEFSEGDFSYLDSYYGGADFIGEEVVYYKGVAVWAQNYYGKLLAPELISAAGVGKMLKASLSKMYREGRFLGGYIHSEGNLTYFDTSEGDFQSFTGKEWITLNGETVYTLVYHGGFIRG